MNKANVLATLSGLCLISLLSACGGGGSGGANNEIPPTTPTTPTEPTEPTEEPTEPAAPTAEIVFPPASALTDKDRILIRGTAEGDNISNLRVNGIDAISSDGFATWQAEVPLSFGKNSLVVALVDQEQNSLANAASVTVNMQPEFFQNLDDGIFDPLTQEVLLIQDFPPTIFALNTRTAERRLISGDGRGSGPELDNLSSITLDVDGRCAPLLDGASRCALVINDALKTIIAVDLATGNRAEITGPQRGDGPQLSLVQRILMDTATDCSAVLPGTSHCALVTDRGQQRLYAVDIDSGDRAIISGLGSRGNGPGFRNPTTISLDPENACGLVIDDASNCVLVANRANDSLLAVDLDSGHRAVLSGATRGAGPSLESPEAFVLDASNSCATVMPDTNRCGLILDKSFSSNNARLLAINLDNGNRAVLSDRTRGQGPTFDSPESILLGIRSGQGFVVSRSYDALIAVDLTSCDRSLFPDLGNGSGPQLVFPGALLSASPGLCNSLLDAAAISGTSKAVHCAMVLDQLEQAIFVIDLNTADRAIIASNERGEGPDFGALNDMLFADEALCQAQFPSANQCLLVLDALKKSLLLVDPETGDRLALVDENSGSGPELVFPNGLALPSDCTDDSNCALVLDAFSEDLFTVDLATGERRVLSSSSIGAGPELRTPTAILAMDDCDFLPGVARCAIVADLSLSALLGVDLSSGDRYLLSAGSNSTASRGEGPNLDLPLAMVLAEAPRCALIFGQATRCLLISNAQSTALNEGMLIAVDIDSGDRRLVLDNRIGNGPALPISQGFFLDESRKLGVSLDGEFSALQILDLETDERVITSWSGRRQSAFRFSL